MRARPFHRVLVANRGEIAVRVLRACRQRGLETVAVVSEADRASLAAQLADQVVEIGPAPASESYLRIDAILGAARETGADAVHPGYGFLAENAGFARACDEAGLVFVGPSADVIDAMGVKTEARRRMHEAGVPVVPGALLEGDDPARWEAAGAEVGYPLLVKAAAGGGGKGMRAVHAPDALVEAIGAARREAASAFGDATVYLERLLQKPRHVEVQVLGDTHGHVLHLGERDCSVQRRHQKVVEESPAPGLSDDLRARLHDAAVRAARAVDYVGAGTVEMLLDASGDFFFLEMNTRLQVEHPVTEHVTGVDLVEAQLRVAAGERLALTEDEIRAHGHSIEVRLYAEDPSKGFLPQTGVLHLFEPPAGPGVRVDTGVTTGSEVTLHYDPMIAKLCAWGADREQSRRRLVEALRETTVLGPTTNLSHLLAILEHEAFAAGEVHTGFLEQHLADWSPDGGGGIDTDDALWLAAAAIFALDPGGGRAHRSDGEGAADVSGPWEDLGPLRLVPGSREDR